MIADHHVREIPDRRVLRHLQRELAGLDLELSAARRLARKPGANNGLSRSTATGGQCGRIGLATGEQRRAHEQNGQFRHLMSLYLGRCADETAQHGRGSEGC